MNPQAMSYVRGAERMVTGVRLTPNGLYVRFADEREGVIPFRALELPGQPHHVSLPSAYVIEVHLVDGTVEEIPWDFARHFADAGYRVRSKAAGARDRRLFGKQLRALRTDRGLTQQELAERAGISRVTIARFEAGEQLPRYQTMIALADGLGVAIECLIAETPD